MNVEASEAEHKSRKSLPDTRQTASAGVSSQKDSSSGLQLIASKRWVYRLTQPITHTTKAEIPPQLLITPKQEIELRRKSGEFAHLKKRSARWVMNKALKEIYRQRAEDWLKLKGRNGNHETNSQSPTTSSNVEEDDIIVQHPS